VASYVAALEALGGTAWDAGADRPAGPLVVLVATGGTEREILDRACFAAAEPALLVAHPGHNSLPAALEVLARVQQLGMRGEICYLRAADDGDGLAALAALIRDQSVRCSLQASRIGLVGEPSEWLVASSPTCATVREVWGPTVVPLPVASIVGDPAGEVAARGEAMARAMEAGASAVEEPAAVDLLAAGRACALLSDLVEAEHLDAVAVRCFDLVVRRRTTGCLALAQLNDAGVVAGCEGDLVATVAMLWLRLMTGAPSWMANPARVDPGRGTLTLAHCTVARSLVGRYRLRSHFESGLGVAIAGEMAAGPVTLVRLGGARMERMQAFAGQVLRTTADRDLCRTQVEVEIGRDAVRDLLSRPLGNHLVLAPGHHGAALKRWHRTFIA
jgi:L-fucose isomerase-like protein